jgi:hypothetical protein
MLITKTKMAEIAGVSQSAVGKACRKGALQSAVCSGKIDMNSEAARAYLRKKGIDPDVVFESSDPISNSANNHVVSQVLPNGDTDPRDLEKMTLPQICEIYGTDERFKHWTSARKTLTEIQRNEIANAKAAGRLIARELVKVGIIDQLDSVFRTLLTDTSKTISIRSKAMAESGSDTDDIKKLIVDQISSVIRPAKVKMMRVFENA